MNYNKKRHKLLKILTNQKTLSELSEVEYMENDGIYIVKHIPYLRILDLLKITEYQFNILIKELTTKKEVNYYYWNDEEKRGLFATPIGQTSFSNKIYLKINRKDKIEKIKDTVQIVVPILSLIIAYYALVNRTENLEKLYEQELKQVKYKLKQQERKIYLLENQTKNTQINYHTDIRKNQ